MKHSFIIAKGPHLQSRELGSIFKVHQVFTTKEACEKLSMSVTSVHRLLRREIEAGRIARIGAVKRPTGYRILPVADQTLRKTG